MTTTINGLHSCKPGNEPIQGEVKTFVLEQRKSAKGKPWLKIKSAPADMGGTPYRILKAEQTDFVDQHGNLSFNLEIESQNGSATPTNAPQRAATGNGGEDRSNRIERQHSQDMSLRYFALSGKVPTTKELRDMTSWFQRDIGTSPVPIPVGSEPAPQADAFQTEDGEEIPF